MTKKNVEDSAWTKGRFLTPRHMTEGQEACLNRDTHCGLFEAINGNRYLITWDNDIKIAIALCHRHLPAFTGQGLAHQPLEYGQWWGPARLRLTHPVDGQCYGARPGVIELTDRSAHMWCRSGRRGHIATSLGYVPEAGDTQQFKGWSLEPVEIQFPFFVRSPNGETSLGAEQLDAELSNDDVLEVHIDPDFVPDFGC